MTYKTRGCLDVSLKAENFKVLSFSIHNLTQKQKYQNMPFPNLEVSTLIMTKDMRIVFRNICYPSNFYEQVIFFKINTLIAN